MCESRFGISDPTMMRACVVCTLEAVVNNTSRHIHALVERKSTIVAANQKSTRSERSLFSGLRRPAVGRKIGNFFPNITYTVPEDI